MKVDITYKCSMHCSHCMSNCDERGKHMTLETFDKVIQFHKKYQPNLIILTGGEIFEHPQITTIIGKALANFKTVALLTNGFNLSADENLYKFMQNVYKAHSEQIKIQVTNDPRYYPQKLSEHQKTLLRKIGVKKIDEVIGLYPQGRAFLNFSSADWLTIAPKCVNVRLLPKQGYTTLENIISTLAGVKKFCTPTIAPDGGIKLGESALCPNCACIDDSEAEIIDKILNFKCSQCAIPLARLKDTSPLAYKLIEGD